MGAKYTTHLFHRLLTLPPSTTHPKMLLNGHNVNGKDYDDRTALMVSEAHLLTMRPI